MAWLTVTEYICVTNDHGYDPLVISTYLSFPHSWLITGFVTRVIWRMSLVEKELLALLKNMSSPLGFSGVRVARPLGFCMVFCRSLFVHFPSTIVVSLLLFIDSGYPFGIFLHIAEMMMMSAFIAPTCLAAISIVLADKNKSSRVNMIQGQQVFALTH